MTPGFTTEEIIESPDYRAFLKAVLRAQTKNGKANFSQLSRKAGFTSRSFIQEVMEGKKRISITSLPRFIKAFSLNKILAGHFTLLVAAIEKDVNSERLTPAELAKRIENSRERLRRKSAKKDPSLSSFFSLGPEAVQIYASLGSPKLGASLEQVQRRTALDPVICRRVLEEFLKKGLVTSEQGRYFLSETNFDLSALGRDLVFENIFAKALGEVTRTYKNKLKSPEESFFYSAFSVRRERMPEMKKRFTELLLEYIDEEQSDDGDAVAKVIFSLYL